MASADDKCHFFRLPLELRDEIYDMAAADDERLALRIDLRTSQESEPKITAYSITGLSRASSEVRREYAVALGRRIRTIITQSVDDRHQNEGAHTQQATSDHHCSDPANEDDLLVNPTSWKLNPKMGGSSYLDVSQTRHIKNGFMEQNAHTLTISIPYRLKIVLCSDGLSQSLKHARFEYKVVQKLMVTFVTGEQRQLADRVVLAGPGPGVHCYHNGKGIRMSSREATVAMEDIIEEVEATEWKGMIAYASLWEDYVGLFLKKE